MSLDRYEGCAICGIHGPNWRCRLSRLLRAIARVLGVG